MIMKLSSSTRQTLSAFLLFTGLLTSTASCKKDKNDFPEPTPPPPAAQKIKEFKDGEEFIRFDYNAAGDVTKVTINSDLNTGGTEMVYTVQYNAAKKIAALESPDGIKIVPVYENNIMTRADMLENGERIGYTNYLYENGQVSRSTIYFGEDTDFMAFLDFIFTYNTAGNISKAEMFIKGQQPNQMVRAGHVNFQHDDKNNPLHAQRDLLALFWQGASKNNIKVEDHFDAALQPEDKFVYYYQYNNNGLPKSAMVKQGLPGQPDTTSSLQFTYQ